MRDRRTSARFLVHLLLGGAGVFSIALLADCGPSKGPTEPTSTTGSGGGAAGSGPLVFRASPVALDQLRYVVPLGNMNPPSHTLSTDHVYFTFADPDTGESPLARRTDLFAPGDGTVRDVIVRQGGEQKVSFQVNSTVVYYIDHLIPSVPLQRGTRVTAGQRLGVTGTAYGIDLGVVNDAVTLSFVNPSRYGPDTLHADAPLTYFEEPLRGQLYAKVRSLGPNLDGKIDFDVPGRLSGNWFGETDQVPLTFAYDNYNPTQVRICIAGGLTLAPAVFAIAATDPAPRDVSVASGRVTYTVTRSGTGPPVGGGPIGRMLVEMLDDQRIRVEVFTLATAVVSGFTSGAKVFVR